MIHQLSAEQIAFSLDRPKRIGADSFQACCPAHDDRNPSMTIKQDSDRVLVHCFSGCPQDAVIDALKSRGLWPESRPVTPQVVSKRADTSGTEARAQRAVSLSTPAPDNHAYLVKKVIQPHGIGVLGELYKDLPAPVRNRGNVLVIPMQDVHGKVLSCQFIAEDGSKAYMAGPKRKGGFYFIAGNPRLWICEGFATGASLYQDTGDSVAVAFDSGGLMPVAGALTALYPRRDILIMADDDWQTSGNPGLTKAQEAAEANCIKVLMPDFGGMNRGPKDTDFNDMVRLRDGN